MSSPKKWRCTVCGYIHEGEAPPAQCPLCAVGPELFEVVDDDDKSATEQKTRQDTGLLIIGAGVAGTSAAEAARKQDLALPITLLSKEAELPYYRINLSRYLAGEIDAASLQMHDQGWYQQRQIDWRQAEVHSIDRARQQVRLIDGEILKYRKLIIASGAHAFFPPIPGLHRQRVWALRSKRDADAILAFAQKDRRCVVSGGGLLGLEAAGALRRQGVQVQIVEGAPHLLHRQLAPRAGALLQAHIEKLGMQVHCAARVQEIVGDEAVRGVELADGPLLAADFVVVAAGVRPNVQLARDAGIEVKRGIVVNAQMQTLDDDVLAAGDLAEHQGVMIGLWMSAFKQGQVAGAVAAGAQAGFKNDPPPQRLKVLDVDLFSIGAFLGDQDGEQVFEDEDAGNYTRIVCKDNKIIGANLFGDASLGLVITRAIEKQQPLSEQDKLLQAFSALQAQCAQGPAE